MSDPAPNGKCPFGRNCYRKPPGSAIGQSRSTCVWTRKVGNGQHRFRSQMRQSETIRWTMTSPLEVGPQMQTNDVCRYEEPMRVESAILGWLPHGMGAGTARRGGPVNSHEHAGYGTQWQRYCHMSTDGRDHRQFRQDRGQSEPDRADVSGHGEISRGTCRAAVRTVAAGVRR